MNYPKHWWEPAPEKDKPEWEILPQAAGPGEVIISKRNELGHLSNFWHTPFNFRGKRYNSIEGFWQAMFYPESPDDPRAKFPGLEWPYSREFVSQMESHEAFAAGMIGFNNMRAMGVNYVTLDGQRYEYWTTEKNEHYALVVEATWSKMNQNPRVREVLMSTGDLKLRADHYEPADAPPSWRYYQIWMDIRDQLRR